MAPRTLSHGNNENAYNINGSGINNNDSPKVQKNPIILHNVVFRPDSLTMWVLWAFGKVTDNNRLQLERRLSR